jgi:hypothetical protein
MGRDHEQGTRNIPRRGHGLPWTGRDALSMLLMIDN